MAATGAEMITLLNSGPSIEFRPAEGLSFDVFLDDVRKAGIRRNVTQVRPQPFWYAEAKREHRETRGDAVQLLSAHQMGSARMGCDPKSSVVDSTGECWDVQGKAAPKC